MPLPFVPDAGDVLMCNFSTGFKPPEMVKNRRVIVLSPRSRTSFPDTYVVVPISKTPPSPIQPYHHEFKAGCYDFFDAMESVWAKSDMVTCVAHHRLDRIKINGRYSGARIRKNDLQAVRRAVLHALGLENWHDSMSCKLHENMDIPVMIVEK